MFAAPWSLSVSNSTSQTLHVIERLTFGPRPGDIQHVDTIGIERFIQEQLSPQKISESDTLKAQLSDFSTLRQSPLDLLKTYVPLLREFRQLQKEGKASIEGTESADEKNNVSPEIQQLKNQLKTPALEAAQARLLRAIESPRQLQEVMTDFWYNHFNVYQQKQFDRFLIGAYEEQAIRPYVLGRFRDLLGATAHHPAMLIYLDNWQNTDPNSEGAHGQFKGLNENYARELMELHTLGVDGGYTQQDVTALARIMTGWGLPRLGQLSRGASSPASPRGFYFDASRHDNGDKKFLGYLIHSAGQQEGEQALDILARHPATAKHIVYELTQAFVSDEPSPALVNQLTQRYLTTDGSIREVLNTLFHSEAFLDGKANHSKYKTPYRYLLSSVRATGQPVQNTFPLIVTLQQMGMPLYGCLTPDGYKNTADAWMSPDALAKRLNFATIFAQTGLGLDQVPPDWKNGENPQAALRQMLRQASTHTSLDPKILEDTYQGQFSEKTIQAVQESSPQLRSALLLGSPERMHY
jgi:uncharacterized protein (DUF1800 family)